MSVRIRQKPKIRRTCIDELRRLRGKTLMQLEEETGIHNEQIIRFRDTGKGMSGERQERLARALGVERWHLFAPFEIVEKNLP